MKTSLAIVTLSACVWTSCIVSKKKFDQTVADKVRIEADLMEKSNLLNETSTKLEKASTALARIKKDSTLLMTEYGVTEKKLLNLKREHDRLNSTYKELLNSSGELNKNFTAQRNQLLNIQQSLEKTRLANDSLSVNLVKREKKVKELETILADKTNMLQDLKLRITNALLNFKENDLTVAMRDGKVYVSLAEQLLFAPGKIDVDQKGEAALQQLAKALRDQSDIGILVEGHTDTDPIIKTSQYMNDNWDLSVMRATSITRILTKAGVFPKQITAAGRGEYSPLVQNNSSANKKLNRRTEIIITPNLSELYSVLDTKK